MHTLWFNHTLALILTVLTALQDCSTSQAVTYPEEAVIFSKRYKIRDTVNTLHFISMERSG